MTRQQRWTLLIVSVAAFMLLLDLTIITVALTDIQEALDSSFDDLQWVIDAYALSLAAFLLAAGTLADRIGRRKVFLAGLALFTLSSLGCAAAWSPLSLILFRAVQGAGGAVMLAAGPALIAQEFELGPKRDRAFAAFGGAAGLAIAAGPLIGGALTNADWRWIFLVNLPVGAACYYLTAVRVGETRDQHGRAVDWPGAALLCSGLFLLAYALMRGEAAGWASVQIIAGLAGSALLLGVFGWWQTRAPAPLMDLRLFRSVSFSGLSLATLLAYTAFFPAMIFTTLYLQQVLGYSAWETGLKVLPLTGALFVASALAAPLSSRIPPRALLATGLAATGTGLLALRGLTPDSAWTALLPGLLCCGLGMGIFNVVRTQAIVSMVPSHRAGEASGIGSTFQELGVALGVAVLGSLFQNRLAADGFTAALDSVFLVSGVIAFAATAIALLTVRADRGDATGHVKVRKHVQPVLDSALESLGRCDHADAVAVDLPAGTSAVEFTRIVFTGTPPWVLRLLTMRDKAMAPFGLQTQERVAVADIRVEPGLKMGPFRLLTVTDDEVLCGDNDKHLNFRTSFAVRPSAAGTGLEGVCTTAVRFHRPAGRLYFKAILPFHHLIVPRIVARAAARA
jgi:EmrB/QacA subfamily drug resistance transporter